MFNKRGFSGVVSVLMLVLLVVVLIGVVWVMVNNLVKDKIHSAESCFGIFNQVSINSKYTCYNSSADEVQFSINVEEIDIEGILISIVEGSANSSKSFELTDSLETVSGLRPYPSGTQVTIPNKNSGRTYIASGFSLKPTSIEIAPIVNEKLCEATSITYDIPDCSLIS